MDTAPTTPASRIGTPGLDVFKIAGTSISGFLHSWKTGNPRQPRQPFTSLLEERLALYLEYHPQVRTYQRGDASAAFVSAYRLATPLETPYRIPYLYEGQLHHYLPDFVGTLSDGSLLIAEAGLEREKRQGAALAKAEAARHLAQAKGGVYWIGTEVQLSLRRHHNLLYLHARRQPFTTEQDIVAALLADWPWGDFRCVEDWVRRFGSRWSEAEVEAAVWKVVAEAAAAGRLLVDLSEVELQRDTPLALLSPDDPPLLPDPLPSHLDVTEPTVDGPAAVAHAEAPLPLADQGVIPGPTIDGSAIQPEPKRQRFYRNLAAVTEVLRGGTLAEVAQKYDLSVAWLWQLVERVKTHGQLACVPHGTYQRERALRSEFQQLIRLLYTQRKRPTMMEVFEDVRLKCLAEELSQREGTLVLTPTYRQVRSFIQSIAAERSVAQARSGLTHPPRERLSPSSFVLSIPSPALLCQVDEHTLDLRIVTQEGTVVTRRVHAAVLICVKTAAILGAVLALDSLKEEDYMRLVKQALEPKDRLVSLYECQHRWPCFGKPAVIFHDRGKIFTSERARQVVVDRLGIVTEQAPPYCPTAKGTVEALFTWTTRKLEHRLPGTTKATPTARGAYDSDRAAHKAGITFDVLEKFFIQAIVDGYMQEWDTLRRQTRLALWEAGVHEKGVPRWMGSPDDLKLLLMKAVNRKNPTTGRYALHPARGLSFLGHRYVSPGLLDRLRGKEIDIYYDRRDLSVIYLFLEGALVGEAYCVEFGGRRVSLWEAQAEQRADRLQAARAAATSLEGRQRIQQEATAGRRLLSLEAKRLEQQRHLDQQRAEIHPAHTQAVLHALAEHQIPPSPLAPPRTGLLPPAIPEDEETDAPVVHLPVRPLEETHD